jgi:hypothetical protein
VASIKFWNLIDVVAEAPERVIDDSVDVHDVPPR